MTEHAAPKEQLLEQQSTKSGGGFKLLGGGGWRQAWRLPQGGHNLDPVVLKTLLTTHDQSPLILDYQRRDALVTERLSGNSFFVDIYSYCGFSAVYEFAGGGDLVKYLKSKTWTSLERLQMGKVDGICWL